MSASPPSSPGIRSLLLVGLLVAGCKAEAPRGNLLLSQVRQALADRDAALASYQLAVVTREGAEEVKHRFFFRAPNKLRAVVDAPRPLEWSFDGKRLYKLEAESKAFSTFELKLPQEKAAMFLHSTFAPFVLEGFRTPLMPMKGVTATRLAHPRGPEAVELKLEPGEGVTVSYLLRWPGADFLERRSEGTGGRSELKVEEEQCEPKLKLCVPKRAAEFLEGKRLLTIELTGIALNPELPADDFSPAPPAGWTTQTRQVVEEQ